MSISTQFLKLTRNLIIIFSFILVIITVILVIYPVFTEPQKAIQNEMTNGVKLSASKTGKVLGGWDGFVSRKFQWEIVMTKFDLFYPVYSIVSKGSKEATEVGIQQVQLKRTSIFTFEVTTDNYASAKMSFDEAKLIAQKYDLSKENPDPNKINNTPSPQQHQTPQPTAKENHYNLILDIKQTWDEDMKQAVNERWSLNVLTYEEFRSHPKIIEMYGTVEYLGV